MADQQVPPDPQDAGAQDGAPPKEGGQQGAPPPPPPPPGAGALPLAAELQAANASKDDRTWGMAAHLSALAGFVFPFGNILGPLVVWLIKKDQSPFVAYHAKQSMWFQIFVAIVSVVLVIAAFCTVGITAILAALVGLGALVYAVYGGIQVSGGKDFEYYWVGEWVRKSA